MCFSSARIALFKVHPYFSRNEVGTSAEMSKRGLHNPRIAPFKSLVVDIFLIEVMKRGLQLQLDCKIALEMRAYHASCIITRNQTHTSTVRSTDQIPRTTLFEVLKLYRCALQLNSRTFYVRKFFKFFDHSFLFFGPRGVTELLPETC